MGFARTAFLLCSNGITSEITSYLERLAVRHLFTGGGAKTPYYARRSQNYLSAVATLLFNLFPPECVARLAALLDRFLLGTAPCDRTAFLGAKPCCVMCDEVSVAFGATVQACMIGKIERVPDSYRKGEAAFRRRGRCEHADISAEQFTVPLMDWAPIAAASGLRGSKHYFDRRRPRPYRTAAGLRRKCTSL